ncbi:MAG: alginate export family protein, partial [Moritella sp.]|uniref:alginate export family protein n=1 Tax=Moritella sp. TaxID=78556 RepID=UPI0029A06A23
AYLQYKYAGLTAKGGRQIMTFDNHRFVGHVGWRQDRQTFDGLGLSYNISDVVQLDYAYIDQRNRIFAEAKDVNSKDNLINASYKTGLGKLTGYAYLLEEDKDIDNGIDTYGIRFSGDTKLAETKVLYTAEYAMQDTDEMGVSYSTNYLALEAGAVFAGFTAKLGYELLGSDDGKYGFATPLATLHKFNGWSDQFLTTPTQGLADIYASVSGKVAGATLTLAYHDFSADESSSTIDDFGSEIDAAYVMPLTKNYKVGLKYASYFAGDSATNKVDTSKVWLWLNATF